VVVEVKTNVDAIIDRRADREPLRHPYSTMTDGYLQVTASVPFDPVCGCAITIRTALFWVPGVRLGRSCHSGSQEVNSYNAPSAKTAKAMQEEVGPRLGLAVVPVAVTKLEDLAGAFEMIIREQLEALHVLPVPVVFASRAKILDFTLQQRLPTLTPSSEYVREGFLMSYGYDILATWARTGSYVDRILRGGNPAELPVEQVDRFQLVINQKTALAINFEVPLMLLSRADEVIE